MKRVFDLLLSSAGIVILSPVLLIVALMVKVEDGGPALFRQVRIGRGGRPFSMWKFRTMVVDAEKVGGQLTVGNDSRITRTGALLRKTKVDELPQLINVLVGDMSFVGPRPEVKRYVDLYSERQRRVLDLVPGITDPASVAFRNESALLALAPDPEEFYIKQIMPRKIDMNLEYSERATLSSDLGIILRTLLAVSSKAGRQSFPM